MRNAKCLISRQGANNTAKYKFSIKVQKKKPILLQQCCVLHNLVSTAKSLSKAEKCKREGRRDCRQAGGQERKARSTGNSKNNRTRKRRNSDPDVLGDAKCVTINTGKNKIILVIGRENCSYLTQQRGRTMLGVVMAVMVTLAVISHQLPFHLTLQ